MNIPLRSLQGFGCAVALASCDGAPHPPDAAAVDPASDTFAEILAADLRNPELTAALGDRIAAIRAQGGSVAHEMLAAGFRRAKAEPGCEALAYEGPERARWGIDDTVRVRWSECADAKADRSEMRVTFGDA